MRKPLEKFLNLNFSLYAFIDELIESSKYFLKILFLNNLISIFPEQIFLLLMKAISYVLSPLMKLKFKLFIEDSSVSVDILYFKCKID